MNDTLQKVTEVHHYNVDDDILQNNTSHFNLHDIITLDTILIQPV